jgi:hypothetical protein
MHRPRARQPGRDLLSWTPEEQRTSIMRWHGGIGGTRNRHTRVGDRTAAAGRNGGQPAAVAREPGLRA